MRVFQGRRRTATGGSVIGTDRKLTRSLALAALGATFGIAPQVCAAPTWFVLNTGSGAVPSYLTPPPGTNVVVIGPNNPTATINGTTIKYLGTDSVAPIIVNTTAGGLVPGSGTAGKFFVAGDLNLAPDQRIYGIGPNLVKLEVGNDANLAFGSVIDVSANGKTAGAGGGAGAAAPIPGMAGKESFGVYITGVGRVVLNGSLGGLQPPNTGLDGLNGGNGTGPDFPIAGGETGLRAALGTTAGNAGGVGQGNADKTSGGAGGVPYSGNFPTNGVGGGGGTRGVGFAGNDPKDGNPGGPGTNGGAGADGMNVGSTGNAPTVESLLNPSATHLRGGSGGGSGAAGSYGVYGGDGGGGAGGGASEANQNGQRAAGFNGGNGGGGGLGGASGTPGEGGGGGGGIQLLVRGRLVQAGSIASRGGNAGIATAGLPGQAGVIGRDGGFAPDPNNFLVGGPGGKGGNGGAGGKGGASGDGAGGTGGVVQIVASTYTQNIGGFTDTQGGINGNFTGRAFNGSAYFDAATGNGTQYNTGQWIGARAASTNPYRSYRQLGVLGQPEGHFANVPGIEGGAAPYGLIMDPPSVISAAMAVEVDAALAKPPVAGRKRVGAVTRVNADYLVNRTGNTEFSDNTQQLLLFTAYGEDLRNPALRSVNPAHTTLLDVVPPGPVRLRAGNGYLNDPAITPGAIVPTDMAALPAHRTFATYVSDSQSISASYTPYLYPRTFRGSPVPSGTGTPGASTVFLEDNGFLLLGIRPVSATSSISIDGPYLESELSGDTSSVGFGYLPIRAGAVSTISASVEGIGNPGTMTTGSFVIRTRQVPQVIFGETGPLYTNLRQDFTNVAVGQRLDSPTTSLPTAGLPIGTRQRVGEAIFFPNYDSDGRAITIPMMADIFGPTPQIRGPGTAGTTFTFPTIGAGQSGIASFELLNADLTPNTFPWRGYKQGSPELIQLSVLGMELVDPDGVFSLVANASNFILAGNEARSLHIGFDPDALGTYNATLKIFSDWNADVGQQGQVFEISLTGTGLGLSGDFNTDGTVNATDIDLLCNAIETNGAIGTFDVNGDAHLDDGDLAVLVEAILNTKFGDTDTDGDVDLADLGNLATGFGQPGEKRWSRGNFDCDADVDLNDLGTLATNFEAGRAAALAQFETLVPEPAAMAMCLVVVPV